MIRRSGEGRGREFGNHCFESLMALAFMIKLM
jgi:hypothetical protein